MIHIKPSRTAYSIHYDNGYANLTLCSHCNSLCLDLDNHRVNPCKWCGHKVNNYKAGKWIPDQYKGILFFRKLIKKRILENN